MIQNSRIFFFFSLLPTLNFCPFSPLPPLQKKRDWQSIKVISLFIGSPCIGWRWCFSHGPTCLCGVPPPLPSKVVWFISPLLLLLHLPAIILAWEELGEEGDLPPLSMIKERPERRRGWITNERPLFYRSMRHIWRLKQFLFGITGFPLHFFLKWCLVWNFIHPTNKIFFSVSRCPKEGYFFVVKNPIKFLKGVWGTGGGGRREEFDVPWADRQHQTFFMDASSLSLSSQLFFLSFFIALLQWCFETSPHK